MDEIVPDASDSTIASAIETNIASFYMSLGRLPDTELHIEPDLTWFTTDLTSTGFNGVIQTRFVLGASAEEIGSRVDEMVAAFAHRALPMVWWVTPSTSPVDLATYLTARGLKSVGIRPGMAIDLATLPQQSTQAPEVEITKVTDTDAYQAWVRIFAASYGHQPEIAQRYFELTSRRIGSAETDVQHYLAWLDGAPVATTTLFLSDGVAGLYHVGTLPEARGRGIGTALVQASLMEAQSRGARHCVLYSSAMGLNIYRRLGFKVYCLLDRYVLTLP